MLGCAVHFLAGVKILGINILDAPERKVKNA
jgi:hypothetical protein